MAQKKSKQKLKISQRSEPAAPAPAVNTNALLIALAIFFSSVVIYIPAMTAAYIWDDDQEITANRLIQAPDGLFKIWFQNTTADYFPLKSTLQWIEWQLWGINSSGYHIVNILIHGFDAVLIWLVLQKLRVPGAALAALLFGIHPVNVESVAWISELKNTFSLVFFLLALLAYLNFEQQQKKRCYIESIILFVASLLCKTSVVPFPFVLLICAFWQRGKITKQDVLRTIPFFLAAVALGYVTLKFQNERAIGTEVIPIGGFWSRLAGAGMLPWFYLFNALLPFWLIVIYPKWHIDPPQAWQFLPGIALVIAMFILWRYRHSWAKATFCAMAYYIITLGPVLGFFKMSYMRLTLPADHFEYLSVISIIALLAGGGTWLADRRRNLRPLLTGFAVVVVAVFAGVSLAHASIFKDEETLWRTTLEKNPDTWQGHNHLGAALFMKGDMASKAAAFKHFARAVELKPENPEVHNNLGLGYATFAQRPDHTLDPEMMKRAIEEYRRAIQIKDDPSMRTNLANALGSIGKFDEAVEQYRASIAMDPNNPNTHCNLGYTLIQIGDLDGAAAEFEAALKIAPNMVQAQQNLEAVLQRKQQMMQPRK